MPLRLKDKVAIITGSGRGIGKAIALRFSEEGAKVVVDDVNQETGNQTADLIQSEGHTAVFTPADVTDLKMVEAMAAKTIRSFGKIDILVNNAICSTNDVLTNNWDANLNIILKGAQHCSQTIIPEMQKNGGGSIINIASVNGLIGLQGIHAYSAS
ncbi:MAG: SDR family NAD(P)-dependent oxidoreductase, partial [Candidatus Poribacteria bacterium]|nr:SDR family NAD(P)-dependent oxidoreductase [Candidatus Poribacteria bacterium]